MNPSNEADGGQVPGQGMVPDGQSMPPQPPGAQPAVPPIPANPAAPAPPNPVPAPQLVPPAGQPQPDSSASPMTLPLPPNPVASTPQTISQNDVQDTAPLANPKVVDDGDLIEKEWVNKAKQIVDQNRSDPYKQSEELTVFRADYMKKRYNKNIKVDK